MKKITHLLGVAAVCCGLAAPAFAETVYLTSENRAFLTDWVITKNGGCPPGSTMIKEDHWLRSPSYRCVVPRGSTTVYYKPGMTLPTTVHYDPLPTTIVERLPSPPEGEVYVTSDNNIYLIKPDTRTVVDSVSVVVPVE